MITVIVHMVLTVIMMSIISDFDTENKSAASIFLLSQEILAVTLLLIVIFCLVIGVEDYLLIVVDAINKY